MTDAPLLPCPFCGGKAEKQVVDGSWGYYPDKVRAGCSKCDIWFEEDGEDYRKCKNRSVLERPTTKVSGQWNTRKARE